LVPQRLGRPRQRRFGRSWRRQRRWPRVGAVRGVPQSGEGRGGGEAAAGVHAPVPCRLRRHLVALPLHLPSVQGHGRAPFERPGASCVITARFAEFSVLCSMYFCTYQM
uniref:Uncharacterized protein n=1 Tax=Triticum urartu TaxID=4572 RepID=A0A8R7TEF7_TRIUA